MNNVTITSPESVDLNNHGIIEAHAGTGKTYTIVQLALRMLEQSADAGDGGFIHLKNILLVTYTEKAAGELKKRIQEGITETIEIGLPLIETVISKIARIPERAVGEGDKEKLMNLEERLKKQIFGQDEAVKSVVKAVKRSRAGFRGANKPVANFLFAGPTGVGKTELARQLADVLGIFYSGTEAGGLDDEVEALIQARQAARSGKNWAEADRIRDKLSEMGILLEDTQQGVKWTRRAES